MREDLYKKYGYCIIPEGTILYRTYNNKNYSDCMFFTIKSTLFWNSSNEKKRQIWRTKRQIKVLFLIEHLDDSARALTTVDKLFRELFPNYTPLRPTRFDLEIKNDEREIRRKFIEQLFHDFNVSGWFSSIENNEELEVCLFDKDANIDQLDLIQSGNFNLDNYKGNSLKQIEIYPTNIFFENTRIQLKKSLLANFEDYKEHVMNNYFNIENDDIEYNKIDCFDLRWKLGI